MRCTENHPELERRCIRREGHHGMHFSGGAYWDTPLDDTILRDVIHATSNETLIRWLRTQRHNGMSFAPNFLDTVAKTVLHRLAHGTPIIQSEPYFGGDEEDEAP